MVAIAVVHSPLAAAPQDDPVAFTDLPGVDGDDLSAAFRTLRISCKALLAGVAPLRVVVAPAPPALKEACRAALRLRLTSRAAVRAFFTQNFVPHRVAGDAFFTGYYEPVVAGSLVATPTFATPLYARPTDLVGVVPGATSGLDPALSAARRQPNGKLVALPDRAAIEAGALGAAARPIVYVQNPAEAFFIQVQGSARIRLADGRLRRLVYDGRNGYPYTAIGKILVARLNVPPSAMGMTQLKAWILANGPGPGEAGGELMRQNRSFIFFRFDNSLPADAGPIGGEGVSLSAGRSLAIDRTVYPYGLPFYVATTLPDGAPFRRLMVGQDTGSAILGAARADVFFGTGEAAAASAGAMRQPGTLFVLWPKAPNAASHGAGR